MALICVMARALIVSQGDVNIRRIRRPVTFLEDPAVAAAGSPLPLAEQFQSTMLGWKADNTDREELRLLSRPLFRYEPVEGPINDRIDEGYRTKYKGSPYLSPMIGPGPRSATVKVTRREAEKKEK